MFQFILIYVLFGSFLFLLLRCQLFLTQTVQHFTERLISQFRKDMVQIKIGEDKSYLSFITLSGVTLKERCNVRNFILK